MVRKLKNYVVKKYRENEWLQRATRTFAQAAVGTIAVTGCVVALVIQGIVSGLSLIHI